MSKDRGELVPGIWPRGRHPNTPDFIVGKFGIRRQQVQELGEFINNWFERHPNEDFLNIEMKETSTGKFAAFEDTYDPSKKHGDNGNHYAPPKQPAGDNDNHYAPPKYAPPKQPAKKYNGWG